MSDNEYYKSRWKAVLQKCQEAAEVGGAFYPKAKTYLLEKRLGRAEFALGCHYMPRGFYCPSPDIECIITNMRRGRIAKKPTKSSKPTNFYMFDKEGKLYLVETFFPNDSTQTEYVVHGENMVHGFVYDQNGVITQISIEEYERGRLCNYVWAMCRCDKEADCEFNWVINETFRYLSCRRLETDMCDFQESIDGIHLARRKAVFNLDDNGRVILSSRELQMFTEYSIPKTGDGLRKTD